MLADMIMSLLETKPNTPEREAAYRLLEQVGVDRVTANVIACEFDGKWR